MNRDGPADGLISATDRAWTRRLSIIAAIGLLLRVAVSWCALGTNDAITWERFGRIITQHGLTYAYQTDVYLNHPPLMCWYARWVWSASPSEYWFVFNFRILPILADALTCWLMVLIGGSRGRAVWGFALAAAFAWNPVAILVSGYHTNTDSVYVMFSLLAAYLVATRRPFWAGLALGAALNVKLIPLVLLAPLLAANESRRAAGRMLLALAIMSIPFIPLFITIGPTIRKNMLDYNSDVNRWGIIFFTREAVEQPNLQPYFQPIQSAYRWGGRYLVLGGAGALAVAALAQPKRWDAYILAALAYCSFLIFTPGFGVQYLLCVTPFLLVVEWRTGWVFAGFGGTFMILQYAAILNDRWPLLSFSLVPPMPLPGPLFGLLAWATLISFSWRTLAREGPPALSAGA